MDVSRRDVAPDLCEQGAMLRTSERELQHWREQMRERGSKLSHTPDTIAQVDGQEIDIEVELKGRSAKWYSSVITMLSYDLNLAQTRGKLP